MHGECNHIPSAKQSPRIEGGVMYWVASSQFPLYLDIFPIDANSEAAIELPDDCTITITFKNSSGTTIHTETFNGEAIEDNSMLISVDSTLSAKFTEGQYTYDIWYEASGLRTPLVIGARITVE